MKTARHLITACTVLLAAGTVAAAPVTPDSYNLLNGNTGSFQYWDQIYTGAGCVTCDNAALSGGRGDLTDASLPPTTGSSTKRRPATAPTWAGR